MILITMRIRELRKKRKWTLVKLSVLIGKSENYLSELERGKRLPSLPVLCAIANAFEVPVTDLFTYTVDET